MEPTPLLGVLAGIGLGLAGGLFLAFVGPVSDFLHRLFEAFVSKSYADAWANSARVRGTGAAFVVAGAVVLVIAIVALVAAGAAR